MATFDVLGPYILPTRSGRAGGRQIAIHDRDIREQFWDEVECWDRPGCYVFAIRHGRGITPYYAGRTFGTFYGECFQPHKLLKYDRVLSNIRRGTPIMFFLPLIRTRGRMNERAIGSLEDTLIKIGLERNAEMTNISGTHRYEVVVRGVWGTGRGRRAEPARDFRKMMKL